VSSRVGADGPRSGSRAGGRLAGPLRIAAAVALVAAAPAALLAQDAPPAGDAPPTGFFGWLRASRSIGVAILLLSVAAIALAVEYALSLRRATVVPDELRLALEELLGEGRLEEARAIVAEDASFLGRVMAAGLARRGATERTVFAAMEEAGRAETGRLYRKVGYLALIANVAPMLGLLGTVGGMMRSFDRIAAAGQPRVSELAGGIRFALVTTYEGLLVAIPTTILFVLFRNRVAHLSGEVAAAADGLIARLRRRAAAPAETRP
jgi:biopolymer transport protein ExbB